jgi:hypothetical protein
LFANASGLTLSASFESVTAPKTIEGFRLYHHRHHCCHRNDYRCCRHHAIGRVGYRSLTTYAVPILQTVKRRKKTIRMLFLVCNATTAEIRQAFRERAMALHPDVVDTTVMSVDQAHEEFQNLVAAYEALMKHVQADDCENMEEWRVALWRQSDRIALDRTDVAGMARKRPVKPAQTPQRSSYGRELGHPSGKGVAAKGEYLSDGTTNTAKDGKKLRSSSVGRGQSKWVKTKRNEEYKEWNPSR